MGFSRMRAPDSFHLLSRKRRRSLTTAGFHEDRRSVVSPCSPQIRLTDDTR